MHTNDKRDDGGPAFPVPNDANVNQQSGMTLRDWFAGQVISAFLTPEVMDRGFIIDGKQLDVANAAYYIADAMIAARNS